MVGEGYADDDIEKMLKEIYLQAQEEFEKSTADMMLQINHQASEERRASIQGSAKRPFRFLFDRMKAVKEKRSESSPPKSLVHSGSEDSFGSRRSSTDSGDSGSRSCSPLSVDSRSHLGNRLGVEEDHRRKKILAIYNNVDWNAEEKYRKVQALMTEDEKRIVQQKGDRLRRKNIGLIYEDKSLTPEEKMGEIFELNQIYENHFSDPADMPMEEELQIQESIAPQESIQVIEVPTGTYDEPGDGSRSHGDARSYSGSRGYLGSRSYSRSRGSSSYSRSHSRSGRSRSSYSSRSPDGSRSYYSEERSQSHSGSRSYSRSRGSSSYSRSHSRSGRSRSSYSSRSRSPDGSRSYYSEEMSPRQPRRASDDEVPSLLSKPDTDDDSETSFDRARFSKSMAIVFCLIIGIGLGIYFGVSASLNTQGVVDICVTDYCKVNTEDPNCFRCNSQDCREYALYGEAMYEAVSEITGDLQKCLDLCAPYDGAAFGIADGKCGCYNLSQCWLRWGDEVNAQNFIGNVYSKRPLQECPQDLCDTVGGIDGRCFTGNTQAYSSYSLFGSNMTEVASSNDVNNKDECLDFCKEHDAAQFLNFQDPKCKCFTGAECWLAWSDQTDTSGALFTGDVYSKKELQICS